MDLLVHFWISTSPLRDAERGMSLTSPGTALTGRGGLDPFQRLRVLAEGYGPLLDGGELVDAIGDQIANGAAFVLQPEKWPLSRCLNNWAASIATRVDRNGSMRTG